jgi:hypothetical protein
MVQKEFLWGTGQVFHQFPKYHMKTLLGEFNAKVGTENTFKPTI